MAIHSSNSYLSLSQMTDNAKYIYEYLRNKGWTKNAICGMLGNMQRESTINPGIWQNLDEGNTSLGFGLCQWTPASKYINWCNEHGFTPSSMDSNLKRIIWELENGEQYYPTTEYPETFSQFTKSTKSVTYLASAFLHNYERAGVSAEAERQENATYWYSVLSDSVPFEPMLDDSQLNDKYWIHVDSGGYNKCIEIENGSVLPNCTGYAWGRFHMISDLADGTKDYSDVPNLSRADAGLWFGNTSDGYERGSEPRLGAVACWEDTTGGAGHVAIVEEIASNGDITCSNSGYSSSRFYITTRYASEGYSYTNRRFQGFIYNPFVGGSEPVGPTPTPGPGRPVSRRKKGYNFIIFNRRKRVYD